MKHHRYWTEPQSSSGRALSPARKVWFWRQAGPRTTPEWTLGKRGTLQNKAVSSLRSRIKTQPPDTAIDGKEQHDEAGAPSLALEDFSESLGKTHCTWPTQLPPHKCHHLCRTNQLPYGYECHCTPHVRWGGWETPRENQYQFQWNRFSFGNLVGGEFYMTNFVSCDFGVIWLTTKRCKKKLHLEL